MTVLFIVIVAVVLLGLLAFCKEAGYWSKKEQQGQQEQEQQEQEAQQKSPCESCLRWGECNGIDDQCPHRKENGKNE